MILLLLGLVALTVVTAELIGMFSGIDDSYTTCVKLGVDAAYTLIVMDVCEESAGLPVS